MPYCRIAFGLQCPPHRQTLKYRRRLEKGEPSVSNRQENHENNFHRPHELARQDARVGYVLPNQCYRAHQKANKVGLDKGPFDLPVVDFAGPVNDDALGQNQGAGRLDEGPQDVKFPIVFPQKDHPKGPRKKVSKDSDNGGCQGMDHEQSIEALAGREIKFEFSHLDAIIVE